MYLDEPAAIEFLPLPKDVSTFMEEAARGGVGSYEAFLNHNRIYSESTDALPHGATSYHDELEQVELQSPAPMSPPKQNL